MSILDEDPPLPRMLLFTVVLGSTPSLPGKSCREIKANEAGEVVSGSFWLDPRSSGEAVLAYCDMNTGGLRLYIFFVCMMFMKFHTKHSGQGH